MNMKYKVTYWFVDDTYWDDGNRTTSRKKDFKSYREAATFCDKIVSEGIQEQSNVTGKTEKFRVDKTSVVIEEITTKVYPWWVVLEDFDYVVRKIKDSLKYDNFSTLASFEAEVVKFYDREYWKRAVAEAKNPTTLTEKL